jgi:NitT/TauT family transport system substrate-binding protein
MHRSPYCRGLALVLVALALATACAPAPAAPAVKPAAAPPAATPSQPAADPAGTTAAIDPAGGQPLSPPVSVKVGVTGLSGEIGLYLAQERGYFRDEGLDVELVSMRGATEALAPLATGELQVGSGGPDPSLFNAVGRDVGVKLVSSVSVITPQDAGSGLVVRQDYLDSGRYQELHDLKSMKVALHIFGTNLQYSFDLALAKGGLTPDDVQLTQVPIADQPAAVANKAVDAAWMIEPFVTVSEGQGIGKRVIAVGDVKAGSVAIILLYSPVFTQQQPEAARRFAVAFLRGQRDYWRATRQNHERSEEIVPVFTKYTALKDPALYARLGWPSVDPDGALNRQALEAMQDYFLKMGTQQERQDLSRVVDPSYTAYAVERLGPATL